MGLTLSQLADLQVATLADLGRMKWTDISYELTEYVAMERLMRKNKVMFQSGDAINVNIIYSAAQSTKAVHLYEPDDVNFADHLATATYDWRFTNTSYVWDAREININAGEAQIVDLLKARRHAAMVGYAEQMETYFWSPLAADDGKTPHSIFFLIPFVSTGTSAAASTGGFNGDQFYVGTNCGNYSHPRWKVWSHQYVAVSKGDLISKMKTAFRRTNFMAPVPSAEHRGPSRREIFTNETTMKALESLGEAQNENLGRDLAPYFDEMIFRGIPIRYVPKLDANTQYTDPLIGIDWGTVRPAFKSGEYMHEEIRPSPNYHRATETHIDNQFNLICQDRRRNWIMAK